MTTSPRMTNGTSRSTGRSRKTQTDWRKRNAYASYSSATAGTQKFPQTTRMVAPPEIVGRFIHNHHLLLLACITIPHVQSAMLHMSTNA